MKHLYILFTLIGSATPLLAQDTLPISATDLHTKVLEKNLQIKIAEKNYQSAKADYQQTRAVFLPNLTASHTAMATTNPLMAFGSKLNQAVVSPADFNPALLNHPERTQNFATKIEIQQPLINADGFYGRQAAKSKMEAYQLQTERTLEHITLELNKAYMQLQLAYKALGVLQKAEATAKANLKLVENYFKNGMLQKTDVISVHVRVHDITNQLQYAKSNIQNASDYLAFLLNEEITNKVYKPTEELKYKITINTGENKLSTQRKDIQAMQKSTEAYEKMFKATQVGLLPRLNAFGSYEMYDKNIIGIKAKGYLVGAQLSWTFFDGFKTISKTQKAKTDFQKAEVETELYIKQSQLEWNKTIRQLKDAENKVHLSKLAFEQSQEAFLIRENRYKQGLEKTTDLLLNETQKAQKEIEYLQAVFEYNFINAYVQFLTH